jgi:hypothetical protein
MEQKIGLLSSLLQQNNRSRNSRSQGELGMFIFSTSFQRLAHLSSFLFSSSSFFALVLCGSTPVN